MSALIVNIRVILALLLREARIRHGRSRIGYSWSIIEPVLLISALTTIFSLVSGQSASVPDFAIFFATGVLPYQYFRNSSQFISAAFEQNRPLFNYPLVKPMDAIFARVVLEFATNVFVMALVLSFQIYVLGADPPSDYAQLLLIILLITCFSFAAGLNLALGKRQFASVGNIYMILMGPSFFLSCVFYSLSSLPSNFRDILVWNPLVHVVEGFRGAYFPDYQMQDVDLMYVVWWTVVLAFFGVLRERVEKRKEI